eukprot:1193107-Prorocentrum_minimum.AAC.2
MPILAVCGDPGLSQHMRQIPFVRRLIGQDPPPGGSDGDTLALLRAPLLLTKTPREAVAAAVEASEMDVVQRYHSGC